MIFKDRRPRAAIHGLCIPKRHIRDIKSLQKADIELLEHMQSISMKVLKNEYSGQEGAMPEEAKEGDLLRLGFHVPPFNSVFHLHLHLIALPMNEQKDDSKYGSKMATIPQLINYLK